MNPNNRSIDFSKVARILDNSRSLKKNDDGTYTVIATSFGVPDINGNVYEAPKGLFDESSKFTQRVKRGVLLGELGHPEPRREGEGIWTAEARAITIHLDRACAALSDFKIVQREGLPDAIQFVAKLLDTPCGKLAKMLLEDASQPAMFAMRAYVDDKIVEGQTTRVIRDIITFDLVENKA